MRRLRQKQILDILKTINQAQSAKLYGDCQEGALALCGFIEEIQGDEGTGAEVISLLIEYCELLFKVNNGEIGEKILRKHLIKIENSVDNKLKPNKIEMVFISYKAAMSDSLESIYLAAKEDPNCDAYWIPVPYYELEYGGAVSKIMYEGAECYPSYIECIDWQKYDIEVRRPVVIFTFNPYDGNNFVTRIHEKFYCERLRGLTDLLVYMPYFITGDEVEEVMVTVPGCVYAHKVIVQSDSVRKSYIKHFKKAFGNRFGKPEDKFIVLGSPKLDKVINFGREDYQLQGNWRSLIDGKKIILYNSSIAAVLQIGEQYLKKLRNVFDVFRNRDDVVLWWRPHPLLEVTYKSMRPQLFHEYNQIVSQYKCESWGIYDDTSDLHRAISWSDAYYGDVSSLLGLYQATNKPIMISNAGIIKTSNDFEIYPCLSAFYDDGNDLWAIDETLNALTKMDRDTWQPEFVCFLYDDYKKKLLADRATMFFPIRRFLFRGINGTKEKLFMSSIFGDYAISFDKSSHEISAILTGLDIDGKGGLFNTVVADSNVFFTPYKTCGVLRYDINTGNVCIYDDYSNQLKVLVTNNNNDEDACFIGTAQNGNLLLMPYSCGNAVVSFNLNNYRSIVHKVGSCGFRYAGICFDGEYYWLTPRDSATPIVKWDYNLGVVSLYEYPSKDSQKVKYPFFSGVYCEGFVWFLSREEHGSVKIDVKTGEMTEFSELNGTSDIIDHRAKSRFSCITDGKSIFTCDRQRKTFIKYNCLTKERKETMLKYSKQDVKNIVNELIDNYIVAGESGVRLKCFEYVPFNLSSWIDSFIMGIDEQHHDAKLQKVGSAGADIYQFCKEYLE